MLKGTTIIALIKDGRAAIAGDGQITFGEKTIMKQTAKKVRKIYGDRVLVGFAGSVADALTLTDKFEGKLEQYRGNLKRAAVELAQEWRTDKVLRKLEAMLVAVDAEQLLVISGNGDVIEPDDQIAAVGSGGAYALAAAKALYHNTDLKAAEVAAKALSIAADICVYTNNNITVLEL